MTGRGLISLPAHEAPIPVVHAADDTSVVLPPPDSATNVVTPAVYAKSGISISRFGRFRISDHGYDSSSSSSSREGGRSALCSCWQGGSWSCGGLRITCFVQVMADRLGEAIDHVRVHYRSSFTSTARRPKRRSRTFSTARSARMASMRVFGPQADDIGWRVHWLRLK